MVDHQHIHDKALPLYYVLAHAEWCISNHWLRSLTRLRFYPLGKQVPQHLCVSKESRSVSSEYVAEDVDLLVCTSNVSSSVVITA